MYKLNSSYVEVDYIGDNVSIHEYKWIFRFDHIPWALVVDALGCSAQILCTGPCAHATALWVCSWASTSMEMPLPCVCMGSCNIFSKSISDICESLGAETPTPFPQGRATMPGSLQNILQGSLSPQWIRPCLWFIWDHIFAQPHLSRCPVQFFSFSSWASLQ